MSDVKRSGPGGRDTEGPEDAAAEFGQGAATKLDEVHEIEVPDLAEFEDDGATRHDQATTAALAAQIRRTAIPPVAAPGPVATFRAKTAPAATVEVSEAAAGGASEAAGEFGAGAATVIDDRPPAVAPAGEEPPAAKDAPAVPKGKPASTRRQTSRGGGTAVIGRTVPWALVAIAAVATAVIVVLANRPPATRLLASFDEELAGDEPAAGEDDETAPDPAAAAAGADEPDAAAAAADDAEGEGEDGEGEDGEAESEAAPE